MKPTQEEFYHNPNPLTTAGLSLSPKFGPPIPNSNPLAFYTLAQARIGGIRSGDTRRFQARNLHAKVRAMHRKGKTQAMIASLLNYNQSTVSRILSGAIRTCLNLRESVRETAKKAALAIRQQKAESRLAASKVMRELTHVQKEKESIPSVSKFGTVRTARNRHLRFYHWLKGQEKKAAARERDKGIPTKTCGGCGYQKQVNGCPCPMCGRLDLVWRRGGYAESV